MIKKAAPAIFVLFLLVIIVAAVRLQTRPTAPAEPQKAPPAQAAAVEEADEKHYPHLADTLQKALRQFGGGASVEGIAPSAVAGMYQVLLSDGGNLLITADGGHIVSGKLYAWDGERLDNLSQKRTSAWRREKMAMVRDEDAVVYSPEGETRARVTVFTDVTCPYCMILHKDIGRLNAAGIEVRYLAYPRRGVGTDAYWKMVSAWCAGDRKAALDKLMVRAEIEEKNCDNPIADHYALGRKVGVATPGVGTPALIADSGLLIPGYRTLEKLSVLLGVR